MLPFRRLSLAAGLTAALVALVATRVPAVPAGVYGATHLADVSIKIVDPEPGMRTSFDHVLVRGVVTPAGATVRIAGRPVRVRDGVFTASVAVHPDFDNRIEAVATATDGANAYDWVTVTVPRRIFGQPRQSPVVVPPTQASIDQADLGDADSSDWGAGSGYTAVLAWMPSPDRARYYQTLATAAGLEAGVLPSSDFRSLKPGSWVVFSGHFDSEAQAAERAIRAHHMGFGDAFSRHLGSPRHRPREGGYVGPPPRDASYTARG